MQTSIPSIPSISTVSKPLLDSEKVMDVRPIPCSIKHGLILKTWRELGLGDYFILLNDHDPVPLNYQFQAEFPNCFTWEHLQRGPEEFRVKITKVAALPENQKSANLALHGCSGH